jgi:RNA polymerase sigma-70 factor (ECF subfamily)
MILPAVSVTPRPEAHQVTDEALVAAACAGQHSAYTQLVERYASVAFAYAYARLRVREEAEDVVQDTFVRAYAALNRFRAGGRWAAWVMRILRNACHDALRRRRDRPVEPMPDDWLDIAPGPENVLLDAERSHALREAVDALPEKYQTVLFMHYGSGQKAREIATALDLPESTVKGRLVVALKALRQRLGAEER